MATCVPAAKNISQQLFSIEIPQIAPPSAEVAASCAAYSGDMSPFPSRVLRKN
jgi:hypothetical protein